MLNDRTIVGLDVHGTATQAAALELETGELTFRRVNGPPSEAIGYLQGLPGRVLATYEAGDLMRARHRLGKLLLRRDVRFPGPGSNWTLAHWKWLNQLEFDDAPSRAVLADYLVGVRALEQRRSALDGAIEETWPESPWAQTIERLRCMRGINSTTAFGLCAEIGDFHRFKHPATLTSYLGIVPSEHSSGEQTRRGPITKAGSPHARRLLVEAAHHYRHAPAIGMALTRRQDGQDPRACEIAWRAQRRLHHQYRRLRLERGKPANIVTIALARELAAFAWEVGQLT